LLPPEGALLNAGAALGANVVGTALLIELVDIATGAGAFKEDVRDTEGEEVKEPDF